MLRAVTVVFASLLLAGCGGGGDDFSGRAGLEVSSDGTAKPSKGLPALMSGQVAFHVRDGYKLRQNRTIPDAGAVLILQNGVVYMCLMNKRDDFYQCAAPAPLKIDGSGLTFPLQSDGRIFGGLGVIAGTLTNQDGSVEIPGGTVRFMTAGRLPDGSFEPSTLGQFRLEYFPHSDLANEKFLDAAGAQLKI